MKIQPKIYKIAFIVWSAAIVTLSSIPSLSVTKSPVIGMDKIAHFTEYLVFAFLFVKMHNDARTGVKRLLILACIIPLLDELHQIPIPGRDFSFYDILADTWGFLVVIFVYWSRFRREQR